MSAPSVMTVSQLCGYYMNIIQSALTLKPPTGKLDNIDSLITVATVKSWNILGSK